MSNFTGTRGVSARSYRPEQEVCPTCWHFLKRSHIRWRKQLTFSSGLETVISWAYRCPNPECEGVDRLYTSMAAERLHLKHRRYSRELVVKVGYHRFWQHQTMYEIHEWLTQDLQLAISKRQVLNLIADFLALLRAGQAAKIRLQLGPLKKLGISIDGMQPEKGNKSLYLVREVETGITLAAENLDEGSNDILSARLLEPIKNLAQELGLSWRGVVSDAQESIRLAVANSLPDVPHQVCQFHCLRDAGKMTFETDRRVKTQLKMSFRRAISRLQKRLQALPTSDPGRAVLLDYAEAIHSTLLQGGVAPFDLGGLKVFVALDDLAASLTRCQKKATMLSYSACSMS